MSKDYKYLLGNTFAKGNKPNKTSFKKGLIPWNKGKTKEFDLRIGGGRKLGSIPWNKNKGGYKTKPLSEETKKKISEAHKGKKLNFTIWNKDKKTGLSFWRGKKRPNMTGINHPFWKGGLKNCDNCSKKLSGLKVRGLCFKCRKIDNTFHKNCFQCEKRIIVKRHQLERKKFCSRICQVRYMFSGEKNNNWKGGITPINEKERKSLEYRLWREAVFSRDSYACVLCGQIRGDINADHIKPFALFPELRLAIDNGRTLCINCHKKTYSYFNPKIKKEEFIN